MNNLPHEGIARVVAHSAPNIAQHGPTYYYHNPIPAMPSTLPQDLRFKPQKKQPVKKLANAQLMPPPLAPLPPQENIGIEVSLVYIGPAHTLKKIGVRETLYQRVKEILIASNS